MILPDPVRDDADDVDPLERSDDTLEGVVPPEDEARDDDIDLVNVDIGSS